MPRGVGSITAVWSTDYPESPPQLRSSRARRDAGRCSAIGHDTPPKATREGSDRIVRRQAEVAFRDRDPGARTHGRDCFFQFTDTFLNDVRQFKQFVPGAPALSRIAIPPERYPFRFGL